MVEDLIDSLFGGKKQTVPPPSGSKFIGGTIGGALLGAAGGPGGAIIGGIMGGLIGAKAEDEDKKRRGW